MTATVSYDYDQELLHKINRIKINGQTLEYERVFNFGSTQAIKEDDARLLFSATKKFFDGAGLKFSLVFGSLLGAVRDDGLIKGDKDMDIFVWDEEKLRSSLISFQKNGLKVCRILPGKLYSFMIDSSCYIDVYILRELRGIRKFFWGKSCVSLCGFETPRKFFREWSEIEFLGEKVTCPASPERLLEFWYGSDWRIPQNKKGTYRVKSAQVCHDVLNFFLPPYRIQIFIRKILKFAFNERYRQKILKRRQETGNFFFHEHVQ